MMPVEHAAVEDAISGGGLHGGGRDQAWLDVEPVSGDATFYSSLGGSRKKTLKARVSKSPSRRSV